MSSYEKALQFGRQRHTLVLNQMPEDFLKEFYNSFFMQFDFNSEHHTNEINTVRKSIPLLDKEKYVCILD